MKRTKLAFLVLSAMLIVTGCKEKEQDLLNKDDPVTIEVWHYYNGAQQDEFNRLVREFNKTVGKEKGIVVEGSGQGTISELEANVLDAIQGKAGADQMHCLQNCSQQKTSNHANHRWYGNCYLLNRRYCSCSRRYYADYRLSEKKTCIDRNEYRGGAIRSAPDFVISGKDDR